MYSRGAERNKKGFQGFLRLFRSVFLPILAPGLFGSRAQGVDHNTLFKGRGSYDNVTSPITSLCTIIQKKFICTRFFKNINLFKNQLLTKIETWLQILKATKSNQKVFVQSLRLCSAFLFFKNFEQKFIKVSN